MCEEVPQHAKIQTRAHFRDQALTQNQPALRCLAVSLEKTPLTRTTKEPLCDQLGSAKVQTGLLPGFLWSLQENIC